MATSKKPGLYSNIRAKRERIAHGGRERMRTVGSPGAPTDKAFKAAAKSGRTKTRKKSSSMK